MIIRELVTACNCHLTSLSIGFPQHGDAGLHAIEQTDETIRAAYEVWACGKNLNLKRKGGGYAGPYTEWCWHAFYAATRLQEQAAPSARNANDRRAWDADVLKDAERFRWLMKYEWDTLWDWVVHHGNDDSPAAISREATLKALDELMAPVDRGTNE